MKKYVDNCKKYLHLIDNCTIFALNKLLMESMENTCPNCGRQNGTTEGHSCPLACANGIDDADYCKCCNACYNGCIDVLREAVLITCVTEA